MKKKVVVLFLLLGLFAMMGCAQDASNRASDAKTINIGIMPDFESVPFIIAQRNGYFEQEGVRVNIEHFSSAKDRDSALQSGKLDGVITDMVAVLFANEGGINLRMVARTDGNIQLIAGSESGIIAVSELKGRDIGLSTNTIMEYTVDKMLEAASLNPEEVDKVAIPPLPTRLEMLQGGKVSAIIIPDPLAGLAVSNGATVLSSTDEMANKCGAIAFTAQILEEYPEEIKAIMRAYNQGVAYLLQEPASEYVEFIIEEQGFPAEVKGSFQLPEYGQAQLPAESIFLDVVKWMHEKDLIKGSYEYKDLVAEL